ncbi:MAG: hypothetical protein QOA70_06770 [Nitrososphaeraceae archaeon]|nr:hypothetical protein [Nitrososphaeraceae archaeon]
MVILEVQPIPDGVFYYSLSIILGLALLGIIYKFSDRISRLLEELVKNDVKQDVRLDHHDKDIAELKKH